MNVTVSGISASSTPPPEPWQSNCEGCTDYNTTFYGLSKESEGPGYCSWFKPIGTSEGDFIRVWVECVLDVSENCVSPWRIGCELKIPDNPGPCNVVSDGCCCRNGSGTCYNHVVWDQEYSQQPNCENMTASLTTTEEYLEEEGWLDGACDGRGSSCTVFTI